MKIKALKDRGEQLFTKRHGLLSLWQEISDHFYPERADFTNIRNLGNDMASHLITSSPAIARRDLGNAFSSMLRPTAKEWFHVGTSRPDTEDTEAKQWLQWASKLTKNAMYDRPAQFNRATKEGDHDFAAFGQCVISTELNLKTNTLLYRSWHLRDVAWVEDESGEVATVYRKWKPSAIDLKAMFGDKIHEKVAKKLAKTPYDEINVWHIVMPTEHYQDMENVKKVKQPYISIYIDVDNDHIIEEVGQWTNIYTIPRWATVSGSQYAHSPATVTALGDARLIQTMTATILEAGEKATNPPMLAIQEAIRSDISIYAGGITWVDADYDERLGEVLRPLSQDTSGLGFGLDVNASIKEQIMEAFFLNKLNLPPTGGPDMTAYEVGQRVQEYIRNALPLFEPMEADYNGRLCENTFETLMRAGAYGDPRKIPKAIQGSDIRFTFESPLHEASEKAKVGQFMEAQQILAQAINLDPSTALIVDGKKATRDVLEAVAPAEWLNTESDVEDMIAEKQQQQEAQQML
ncbi:hypothetical protein KA005_07740, partial [bacterium]|nr:hypothetical protein [bacterium]